MQLSSAYIREFVIVRLHSLSMNTTQTRTHTPNMIIKHKHKKPIIKTQI